MVGYDVVLYESTEDSPRGTLELILSGSACACYIFGAQEHCIFS
jgi:hypothetical protein